MNSITNLSNSPAIGAFIVNPADVGGDILTDAENVTAIALREQSDAQVSFDNDVRVRIDGDCYAVDVPYSVVRIPIPKARDYPDQLAKQAMEEAGLKLLAASRATEIVWRDMRRVAKS